MSVVSNSGISQLSLLDVLLLTFHVLCGLSRCVFLSINLLMCSAYLMFTIDIKGIGTVGGKCSSLGSGLVTADTSCPLVDP